MARTESIHKETHPANSNTNTGSSGRAIVGVCTVGIVLAWSACGLAASGPGLGFKVGVQTLDDPFDLEKTTRARFEVELSTPMFYDDHFDFAFTFGGSPLGSYTDEYTDEVDGGFIDDTYHDSLSVLDIRMAARFYPLGDESEIRPYMGAGVGYFWFLDRWHDTYRDMVENPPGSGFYDTYIDEDRGTETPAKGLFTFVTAGVAIPLGDQFELLFDFQYDFGKEDNGYDLGGPIYMIGGRLRF